MSQSLGKRRLHILVTAGPTREYLDPVRFITNQSSGLIGYSIARQAVKRGHHVVLLSGPSALNYPAGVRVYRFETAEQLQRLAERFFPCLDAYISTAAVGDFRPAKTAAQKIKKGKRRTITITFIKTTDVLQSLGRRKQHQVLVGFSLETTRIAEHARKKLRAKNLDFVVANSLTQQCSPFGNTAVSGLILTLKNQWKFHRISKQKLAGIILDRVEQLCYSQTVAK